MFGRKKIAMLVAEFLGTGILTLVVLSVQRSTIGIPYFIALAAGLAVAMGVAVLGNASGAHLNPALTLGLWTARRVKTVPALLYIVMQLLGAWAAYYLYAYFVNSTVQSIGGHYSARILVAEAVGTLVFAFGWAAAAYGRLATRAFAGVAGVSFTLGIIVASGASNGIINPAVALGVRSWVWGTYVLGPVLGALIGVNLFGLLFAPAEAEGGVVGAAAVAPVAVAPATTSARASTVKTSRATTAKKPAAKKRATTRKK